MWGIHSGSVGQERLRSFDGSANITFCTHVETQDFSPLVGDGGNLLPCPLEAPTGDQRCPLHPHPLKEASGGALAAIRSPLWGREGLSAPPSLPPPRLSHRRRSMEVSLLLIFSVCNGCHIVCSGPCLRDCLRVWVSVCIV